jgi:poly(A) polymerase
VDFTGPREDVLRRDFTINGLLYDPVADRLMDFVGGKADIDARLVRAIGEPRERFAEDKLRILRAVRFGARFGYSIEDRTWEAVRAMAHEIHQVSAERVRDELVRILTEGQASRGLRLLEESGLREAILPELVWTPHLERTLDRLGSGRAPDLATAVLLHECAPADAGRVVRRLRFSNAEIEHVEALVANQPRFAAPERMSTSALKKFLRLNRFEDHLELHRLHTAAEGGPSEAYEFLRRKLEEWPPEILRPAPLISGDDLISLGFEPGPSFKKILTAIEDEQLEGRLTDRDAAVRFLRERFGPG